MWRLGDNIMKLSSERKPKFAFYNTFTIKLGGKSWGQVFKISVWPGVPPQNANFKDLTPIGF